MPHISNKKMSAEDLKKIYDQLVSIAELPEQVRE